MISFTYGLLLIGRNSMANSDFKSIIVHHGGVFSHPKKGKGKAKRYVGGKVSEIELDPDRLSYISLLEDLMHICDLPKGSFFGLNYRSPNPKDWDLMRSISNDMELMEMFEATSNFPKIHLYVSLEYSPPPIGNFGDGTASGDNLAGEVDSFHGGDVRSEPGRAIRNSEGENNFRTLHSSSAGNNCSSEGVQLDTTPVSHKGMAFSNIEMLESSEPSLDAHTMISNANGQFPKPVAPGDYGEGSPYAPDAWPNPGDKWTWKVGCRKTLTGYWKERYLYTPNGLKPMVFRSRTSVKEYIKKEFPNANVEAFFSSFLWKIPCMEHDQAEGSQRQVKKRTRSADSSLKGKVSKWTETPTPESKLTKFKAQSCAPATRIRVDLSQPNEPEEVEIIDRQETTPKISGSVTLILPVNSVVRCAGKVMTRTRERKKQTKFRTERFTPALKRLVDIPHHNDPGVVETIDKQEAAPKISEPLTTILPVNSVMGCAAKVSTPTHESKPNKFRAESFAPVRKSIDDLPHHSDPGISEMIDRQETSSKISGPVTAIIPINSVVESATCTDEKSSGRLPTSQVEVAATEMVVKLPDTIQHYLASAVQRLTDELKSTPLEFLGDKMGYFHDHVAWLTHAKFPVEELKQDLDRLSSKYQEKATRRQEIEVQLSEIEERIVELDRKVSELHRKAEELRSENQFLFS